MPQVTDVGLRTLREQELDDEFVTEFSGNVEWRILLLHSLLVCVLTAFTNQDAHQV